MTSGPALLNQDLIDYYEKQNWPPKMFKFDLNGITEDGVRIKRNMSKKELNILKRFNFVSDNMRKNAIYNIKAGYEINKSIGLYSAVLIYSMRIPDIIYLPYDIANELINIFQPTDDGYDKEILDYIYDGCMIVPRIFDTTVETIGDTVLHAIFGTGLGVATIFNWCS